MNNMVEGTLKLALTKNYPMIVIFTVVIVTIRLVYLITRREKFVFYKEMFMLAFLLYSLVLFYVVTFQDVNYGTNNFIPFHEITRYEFGSKYFIKNIVGNIIMYIPFGIFVSFIMKTKKPFSILIVSVTTSSVIEYIQLKIGRTFDIDDIFLNIIGGLIGFFLYVIYKSISEKLPAFSKKIWFRNILTILAIVFIIVIYYSTGLWGIIR